jgi:hypothetical protein
MAPIMRATKAMKITHPIGTPDGWAAGGVGVGLGVSTGVEVAWTVASAGGV